MAGLAQAVTPLHDYFRESWPPSDGLPHNTINNIHQSGDGYLWFATSQGVATVAPSRLAGFSLKPPPVVV